MKKACIIFGDQLSESLSVLSHLDKEKDTILMCEVNEEASYVKHHKAKIAFVFSAMRHFALRLQEIGFKVIYTQIDSKENTGNFTAELKRFLATYDADALIFTEPSEYRVKKMAQSWETLFNIPVKMLEDDRFLITPAEFSHWAANKKNLLLEFFYRMMRKKFNILMKDGHPIGEQWNFDATNRQFPKGNISIPSPFNAPIDSITMEVIDSVNEKFSGHFGELSKSNFYFAVTRIDALRALDDFINNRLIQFGDYQDAMLENEPWMFHSHLSFYLNCGLLLPLECINAAEEAYHLGKAPLNCVEGFIRQILGWREYVRGIYWLYMPNYASMNYLQANRPLPDFFWGAQTPMNCLSQCIGQTQKWAYAHHIQRLMVIGNFALLCGLSVKEVNEWFLVVYADAFEWVEMPNVTGMILYADGGLLGSKPYAAGGSYINKMSNYCKNCHYKVKEKTGTTACPFNYLYWYFLMQHEDKFRTNPRMSMMYSTLSKMEPQSRLLIKANAEDFLNSLKPAKYT
ncbi:cryptochrome/photolyase family protein [Thorsellia kenyensis]|uniref:Cryptochrome/photolyase family protein n=1 Tax=Thorsellia kenyensis TaxID=1549888 RepID=A0ABV6CAC0_9GAMM